MSRISAILLILFVLSACGAPKPAPTQAPGQAPTLALLHATVIDGTGAEPIPDAAVLLARDTILSVGPAGNVTIPASVQTLDLTGMTLLPGFINAHVHRGFSKDNLKAWAEGGVTTVRDEGASPSQLAGLKTLQAEISADPHLARLVSSGVMLAVPGGYGDLYVNSPEEARQAVLDEAEKGAAAIKVALEDGYAGTHGLPKLTPEELRAIVKAAHEKGLPVSGHITQGMYIHALLEAGVDDIAHLAYDYVPTEDMQYMVDRSISWIPTFTVFRNYGAPAAALQNNLRKFVEMGGKVALGNDYGGGPGEFELGIPLYEIDMMSGAGMTPMQVITASTLNAAHLLRIDGEVGTIQAGRKADILVVAGNPLADLKALGNIKLVIHNGVIIRNEIEE